MSAASRRIVAIAGLIGSAAFFGLAYASADNAFGQQFGRDCAEFGADGVPAHLLWDFGLIGSYTATFLAWFSLRHGSRPHRRLVMTLPLVLGVTDVIENVLVATARAACPDLGGWGNAVVVAALIKWVLFGAAVVTSVWLLRRGEE